MIPPIGHIVRRMVRQAGFGLAAVLCLIVAAGFLLAALWLALDAARGAIFASVMVGLVMAGIGLILLVMALARPRPPRDDWADDLDPEALEALRRAAMENPNNMEGALRGLLRQAGLEPPVQGNAPAMVAAFVYGLTLALKRRRR